MANQGPGYTIGDGVYWLALMCGMGGAYVVLQGFALTPMIGIDPQYERIVRLVLSLGVGVGLGFVCESIYKSMKQKPPPQDSLDEPPYRSDPNR